MHTIAFALVALLVCGYVILHSMFVSSLAKQPLCDFLSDQLETRVTMEGDIEVDWFNQVILNQLTIYDQHEDTLIYARRAMVAYEFLPLLRNHLVLNTCQLIDFDIHTYRQTADSAANYQFLIDALASKKNPDEQSFIQEFDLNTIHLHQGRMSYDVMDAPVNTNLPIDPNHIKITQLGGNLHVHDNELLIKRFHCLENETTIQAKQLKMALNAMDVLNAPAGEHLFLASVKNLELDATDFSARLDLEGTSDQITAHLKQLDLPNGHPQIPAISSIHAVATLTAHQLKNPADSLYLTLNLSDLRLVTDRYGRLRANGTLEGMPCELGLDMDLQSEHGSAELTARMKAQQTADGQAFLQRNFLLTGHCTSEGIDLSRITPKSAQLGAIALDVDFEIHHRPQSATAIACTGHLPKLNWLGHTYQDIQIDGSGQGKQFKGFVALDDTLVALHADFDIDRRQPRHHYKIDGEVSHLNTNALNLTHLNRLDSLSWSSNIHADIQAHKWQDAEIDVKLKDLKVCKGERQLELGTITCQGSPSHGHLDSQLARLYYNQRGRDKAYHIEGEVLPNNALLSLLDVEVEMSQEIGFMARADSLRHLKRLHVDVQKLKMQENLTFSSTLDVKDDEQGLLHPVLDLELSSPKHRISGTLKGHVTPQPLNVTLDPALLIYNKEKLQVNEARLWRNDEGHLELHDLCIEGANQKITAEGVWGGRDDEFMTISLNNFEIGQILSHSPKGYLHFSGCASGDLRIYSTDGLHITTKDLDIQDFTYIGERLGHASMDVDADLAIGQIAIGCDIQTDALHASTLTCDLQFDKEGYIDLNVKPDHLPLGFIHYWCGDILQQFAGSVTGDVRLYGDLDHLQLAGHPTVDGKFTHNIIGAHFHFNDVVKLQPGLIHLDHITMDDCHGHPMNVDAKVTHQFLHNFDYDVQINMPNTKQGFLVLDREPADGRMYWGQLYAKGTAQLTGRDGRHRMNLRVGTADKSWFYLSPRVMDVNPDNAAYGFLTFRDKEQIAGESTSQTQMADVLEDAPSTTDLVVNIQLEASEQCEVTVQMDPLSEDLLKGRGHGNLSIVYDPRRDIRLSGDYQITQGTYTMNIKPDLMRKEFQLRNTSHVQFNGVPSEAELSLDAFYNIPSVNLADLGPGITSMGSSSRRTAPVDCNMAVIGHLSAPQVQFGLEVKNVNEDIKTKVHNVIGTEEMINQEVLYLLLFSKFYTPQYVQTGESHTGSEVTAFASASITSQINQLLGHVSDSFRMGTNVRTDKGDFTDMEMDLTLSTRLLGDRLLLNGNVGYRDPANRLSTVGSNNSFIGDFDIEWLLTSSGKIRLKAFSHYNERDYSVNNALSTQGASIILRHDFFGLKDMWPWKLNHPSKAGEKTVKTAPKANE